MKKYLNVIVMLTLYMTVSWRELRAQDPLDAVKVSDQGLEAVKKSGSPDRSALDQSCGEGVAESPEMLRERICQDQGNHLRDDGEPSETISNISTMELFGKEDGGEGLSRYNSTIANATELRQKIIENSYLYLNKRKKELDRKAQDIEDKIRMTQDKDVKRNYNIKLDALLPERERISALVEQRRPNVDRDAKAAYTIHEKIKADSLARDKLVAQKKQRWQATASTQDDRLTGDTYDTFLRNFQFCNPTKNVEGPPLNFDRNELQAAVGFIRQHQQALRLKYQTPPPGKVVYLKGDQFGFPDIDFQFNEDGTVNINNMSRMNKLATADDGKGGSKLFMPSLVYPSGLAMANMFLYRSTDEYGRADELEKLKTEIQVSKQVRGAQRILPLQRAFEAPTGNGRKGFFVQTPLMDGSLTDFLKKGVEEKEKIQLWQDALKAIEEFHGRELVHRDIKTDNFMIKIINGQPRLFLIDFDTVMKKKDIEKAPEREKISQTFQYAAIEFVMDQKDREKEKSDLTEKAKRPYINQGDNWALGVVGHQIFSNDYTSWLEIFEGRALNKAAAMKSKLDDFITTPPYTRQKFEVMRLLNFNANTRGTASGVTLESSELFQDQGRTSLPSATGTSVEDEFEANRKHLEEIRLRRLKGKVEGQK